MAKVYVNKDLGFEDAFRKWKRQVKKSNIIYECRVREYYMTRRERAKFKQKNYEK